MQMKVQSTNIKVQKVILGESSQAAQTSTGLSVMMSQYASSRQ